MLLWEENQKKIRKPNKPKKNKTARPNGYIGVISFFFVFSRFLLLWEENQKNKIARPNGYIGLIFLFLLFFLVFSRFLLLWEENQKNNPRKRKKQPEKTKKKHKIARPNGYTGLNCLFLFVFFGVLGGFLICCPLKTEILIKKDTKKTVFAQGTIRLPIKKISGKRKTILKERDFKRNGCKYKSCKKSACCEE